MLREMLHFAETGNLSAGSLTGAGFDSPFEEAVAQVIREAGYHVHSQVGVSSFRLDLGVIDPARPGEYIIGVECDGATYHSSRSARDRDRLRQEVLEGLGWRLHRIWSTDWFRHPLRETDRLIAAIRTASDHRSKPELPLPLPEVEPESPGTHVLVEPLPEIPVSPDNVVPYTEIALRVGLGRDLLDVSIGEIGRLCQRVVEWEGPVHTSEVARRIREAYGLQQTGSRILAHIVDGLVSQERAGVIQGSQSFWRVTDRETTVIRDRGHAALSIRKAAHIAPAEYQLALITALNDAVAITRADLLVQAARLFGFDRTGPDLKIELERHVQFMIDDGLIGQDGEMLVVSKRVP
jgi:very-short-patch-repair endonuclease